MVDVVIYADTTGQYTDEECDFDNILYIEVPEDLLYQWWCEDQIDNSEYWGKNAWENASREEFDRWLIEESTADDTETLYNWLCAHNYRWERED